MEFNPFCIVLILLIILLILYFFNDKFIEMREKNKSLENFKVGKVDMFNIESPPLIVEAKNLKQLYKIQDIRPMNDNSPYFVGDYPNINLVGEVVGCGGRREPCYGGNQQVINNILPPVDISNTNISPNKISVKPKPKIVKIGVLYKVFGSRNEMHPLYMRIKGKRYPKYYYFIIDKGSKIRRVFTKDIYQSLGVNDQVKVEGMTYPYRVSINSDRFPMYPRIH